MDARPAVCRDQTAPHLMHGCKHSLHRSTLIRQSFDELLVRVVRHSFRSVPCEVPGCTLALRQRSRCLLTTATLAEPSKEGVLSRGGSQTVLPISNTPDLLQVYLVQL